MLELHYQKKVVKAVRDLSVKKRLDEFKNNKGFNWKPGDVGRGQLLAYFCDGLSDEKALKMSLKYEPIIASCVSDGYLAEIPYDREWKSRGEARALRVDSRGEKLLTPTGEIQIYLENYNAFYLLVVAVVGWVVAYFQSN